MQIVIKVNSAIDIQPYTNYNHIYYYVNYYLISFRKVSNIVKNDSNYFIVSTNYNFYWVFHHLCNIKEQSNLTLYTIFFLLLSYSMVLWSYIHWSTSWRWFYQLRQKKSQYHNHNFLQHLFQNTILLFLKLYYMLYWRLTSTEIDVLLDI